MGWGWVGVQLLLGTVCVPLGFVTLSRPPGLFHCKTRRWLTPSSLLGPTSDSMLSQWTGQLTEHGGARRLD